MRAALDYTPVYLSEVEALFESGEMPPDVALIQVSPPDAHGFCSLGVGIDTTAHRLQVRPLRRGTGEQPDAAHLWRQFYPRWSDSRVCRVLAAAVRVNPNQDR